MPADSALSRQRAAVVQRYVTDHRYATAAGSICRLTTEFADDPPPPGTIAYLPCICFGGTVGQMEPKTVRPAIQRAVCRLFTFAGIQITDHHSSSS